MVVAMMMVVLRVDGDDIDGWNGWEFEVAKWMEFFEATPRLDLRDPHVEEKEFN